jgi:hypothetical protein
MPEELMPAPAPSAERDALGHLLPGHAKLAGRQKGALNRFTRAIREEGAAHMREMEARGIPANPIKIFLHVAEQAYLKNDLDLMLRAAVATANVYLPTKTAIEIDLPDEGEAEEKRIAIAAVLSKWTPRELRGGCDVKPSTV